MKAFTYIQQIAARFVGFAVICRLPIAVLANRAEPLSTAIKLRELAVLGETFTILRATFQACVVCDSRESKFVIQTNKVTMPLVRMSASTNRFSFFFFFCLFVPAKAALCTT